MLCNLCSSDGKRLSRETSRAALQHGHEKTELNNLGERRNPGGFVAPPGADLAEKRAKRELENVEGGVLREAGGEENNQDELLAVKR